MKTLGDLIGSSLPILWHEAVAVVQEVASHVTPDGGVPPASDLVFSEDGTITVAGAGPRSFPAVTALGRLLQLLLPEDAPAALHALAAENSNEQPTHPTLAAFTAALAFFERPGRAAHLLGVAARLQNYVPPASTEEELARLRQKVVDAPEEPPATAPTAKRSIHPAYFAGGALALVAVLASAKLPVGPLARVFSSVSLHWPSSASLPAMGSSNAAAQTDKDATPADTVGTTAGVTNRDTVLPVSHKAANRRQSASHQATPAAQSAVISVIDVSNTVASSTEATDGTRAEPSRVSPTGAPPAAVRETAPRVDPAKIYSSADASVIPAALVWPQLPSEPEPGPATGLFDLTVDESGTVVRVRLVSPTGRFQERSLVSAAKAWRFRPALLEGHPVKYRLRVPITLPGQQ